MISTKTLLYLLQTLPRLLDAPSLESKHAKIVSCGARHSTILTGIIFQLHYSNHVALSRVKAYSTQHFLELKLTVHNTFLGVKELLFHTIDLRFVCTIFTLTQDIHFFQEYSHFTRDNTSCVQRVRNNRSPFLWRGGVKSYIACLSNETHF